jgi:hypothetical protein
MIPLSILLGATGLFLLWWLPARQARPLADETQMKRFDAENEARRTLAQVLGGAKLGGIYSLGRIAADSQRDHVPVMKLLAASAREMSKEQWAGSEPPPEMQAILEVIITRELKNEVPPRTYIDLRGVLGSGSGLKRQHNDGHLRPTREFSGSVAEGGYDYRAERQFFRGRFRKRTSRWIQDRWRVLLGCQF